MTTTRRRLLSMGGLAALAGTAAWAPRAQAHLRTGCHDEGTPRLDSQLFRDAVVAGDSELVAEYLDRDPGLAYSRDEIGRSVIVLAVMAGQPEIAELLRERGVTLDLVEAVLLEDWARMDAIATIAPGRVNELHPVGGTALFAAARYGQARNLWRLSRWGADPDANPLGTEGFTAARAGLERPELTAAEQVVVALVGNGADPNAPQRAGDSLLHAAAARGDEWLIRFLLRKGGDASARDAAGRTPLDVARIQGHEEAAELLSRPRQVPRDCRSSRFAYDASGGLAQTPEDPILDRVLCNRFVGVSHGDLEQVRALATRQPALLFANSSQDELGVEAGAHMGRRDILSVFLDGGAPMSLPTAITMGRLDRARALLVEDPNRIRERGAHDFPLIWYPAIGGGDLDAAQLLVDFGIDRASEGKLGMTGLHWATLLGHADLAAFWIDHGIDPNAATRDQHETALDIALRADHPKIADLLRSRGGRRGAEV